MKRLTFALLALCCFFTAPAAAHEPANGEPLIVRSQLMVGGLELLVANLEQQTTIVTLTEVTTQKELFFSRIRKHNGYSYTLNLDELEKGRYILSVKKGDTVRKQVIVVDKHGPRCSNWR